MQDKEQTIQAGKLPFNQKDYAKKYYQQNKDRILKYSKERHKNGAPPARKLYNQRKVKIHSAYNIKWRDQNRETFREGRKLYMREYYRNNKQIISLRNCIAGAFNRIKKGKPAKTETLLGCTWEEAKSHIESLFLPGMTWENHGRSPGCWELDHIRPVTSFSINDMHLMNIITNFQPLWVEDNKIKGNRWHAAV